MGTPPATMETPRNLWMSELASATWPHLLHHRLEALRAVAVLERVRAEHPRQHAAAVEKVQVEAGRVEQRDYQLMI